MVWACNCRADTCLLMTIATAPIVFYFTFGVAFFEGVKGGPNCYGYNASKNETGPGGAKSCVAPVPRHQSVNASLPSDSIVHAWVNQGDVLNAQLSTTKFRSISSMGYYFSAAAGTSTWEYVLRSYPHRNSFFNTALLLR